MVGLYCTNMATKAVCPANTDILKDSAEYNAHSHHDDGDWTIFVTAGNYAPPKGWSVDNVSMLSTGCMVHISRD